MSEEEHRALLETYPADEIELAAHLVLASMSPDVSLIPIPLAPRDAVERKIAELRRSPEEAFEPAFRTRGIPLAARSFTIVHRTVSETNCHGFTWTGDHLAESADPPDLSRYRRWKRGDPGPIYAIYWKGREIAHSAVSLEGTASTFQHKFIRLPVIRCHYMTVLSDCRYDRVELIVKND